MFYIYILYSKSLDHYYTGHTHCITDRLNRHNLGRSKATKGGIPWEIVHIESFKTKSDAYKRERSIKAKKSRKYIEKLIAG
ncbi:MAG: GIY-YIG nuclease family protein [Bacteroidetes bacterium]|nr:GIY-YIG nuclease family protein [Bacteroidota bacterium]